MEEQCTMSNEELRTAIEDTRLARYRTHETDSIYATLTKHFEYLLRIQAARANAIKLEYGHTAPCDEEPYNTFIARKMGWIGSGKITPTQWIII